MVKELLNANRVQSSILLESQSFYSDFIGEDIKYSIYLPKGYYSSDARFPVVYLMHAARGDETSWIQYGQIESNVDELVKSGDISPMIIVLLSGVTSKTTNSGSFFVNDYKSEVPYEEMFLKELIPTIDDTYRTRGSRAFRAVAGCATGGFAALYYSINYPEYFSCCMAMSAAIVDRDGLANLKDDFYEKKFGRYIGYGLKGPDRANENFDKFDLLSKISPDTFNNTRLYVACGDKDFKGGVTVTNGQLHIALNKNGIKHDFRMREGAHNWSFWRRNLGEVLQVASRHFLKN